MVPLGAMSTWPSVGGCEGSVGEGYSHRPALETQLNTKVSVVELST